MFTDYIHLFLTSVLTGGERSASHPSHFTSREIHVSPGIQWTGVLIVPRIGLDDVGKRRVLQTPGHELGTLGSPVCIRSLYRLRYSGYTKFPCHDT
jgi:hypothetical protein